VLGDLASLSESIHALLMRAINGEDRGDRLKVAARELAAQAAALANLALEAAENEPSPTRPRWLLSEATEAAIATLAGEGGQQ
jgi:hypothetical protein